MQTDDEPGGRAVFCVYKLNTVRQMKTNSNHPLRATWRQVLLMSSLLLVTSQCVKDPVAVTPAGNTLQQTIQEYDYGGRVKSIDLIDTYSSDQVRQLLKQINLPQPVATTTGLTLFRIQYLTHRFDQQEIVVSGLVGIPTTNTIKGIVSYQHGTVADRASSVSQPSPDEGLPIAALFAGDGYLLLAPDYIGLGVSTEVPPYLHTASTVNPVVDLLTIGGVMLRNLTNQQTTALFLAGFSQGGYATAAVQRSLEGKNPTGLTLKASASIAGPLNLLDISVPYAFANRQSFYLGYLANAYASVYGQLLNSLLTDPYAKLVPTLFNGSVSEEQITAQLPADPTTMFRPRGDHVAPVGRDQLVYEGPGRERSLPLEARSSASVVLRNERPRRIAPGCTIGGLLHETAGGQCRRD